MRLELNNDRIERQSFKTAVFTEVDIHHIKVGNDVQLGRQQGVDSVRIDVPSMRVWCVREVVVAIPHDMSLRPCL